MPFNMERLEIKGDGGNHFSIRAIGRKVVIDYVTKRNLVRGYKEFKDLGPQRSKSIKG